MMATLQSVKADNFLKTFWTSRHGRTQKPYLFVESLKKAHNNCAKLPSSETLTHVDHDDEGAERSKKAGLTFCAAPLVPSPLPRAALSATSSPSGF